MLKVFGIFAVVFVYTGMYGLVFVIFFNHIFGGLPYFAFPSVVLSTRILKQVDYYNLFGHFSCVSGCLVN